jgi:hypothetical protein
MPYRFQFQITLDNYQDFIAWLNEFPREYWSICIQFYHVDAHEYMLDLSEYAVEILNSDSDETVLGFIPIIIKNKDMAMQFKLSWS